MRFAELAGNYGSEKVETLLYLCLPGVGCFDRLEKMNKLPIAMDNRNMKTQSVYPLLRVLTLLCRDDDDDITPDATWKAR
jgi:hypothetical protein